MFENLENILVSLSNKMPLELFAPFASMIEEIIAPIPSPLIMMATGSLALIQGKTFYYLFVLTLLGALGKLIGSTIVYFISDKVEDIFSGVLEKFFRVTHEDIESFGKKFNGSYKDYFVMFLLRAVPIVPSSIVSIGSGVLKIPLKVFVVSTFLGSIIRDFIYIYVGYRGTSVLEDFVKKSESVESYVQIVIVISVLISLVFVYIKRRK